MRLRTSTSIDSSTSAAQVMAKYDEVDGSRSGAVDKPLKSQKVVKKFKNRQKLKNFKGLKSCESHQFGRMFTKAPILRQLDTINLSFC